MIVITPQELSQAQISSNAAISAYPLWVSGTNYALADRVYYQPSGALYPHDYELIQDGENTTTAPSDQPLFWLDLGVSNRYRMFDGVIGDATERADSLSITLMPGQVVNGIGFFGLAGSEIRVRVDDPIEGIVYDRTEPLVDNSQITNWHAWFFDPISARTDVAFLDMPSYGTADVLIDVLATGSTAKIGEAIIGRQRLLGVSNFGTQIGLRSYSRKVTDEFGRVSVVKRRNVKLVDFDVTFETSNTASVQRIIAELDAVPTLFVGDGKYEATIVYGFLLDFKIPLETPSISSGSLQVEGLI